jgi:UDP-GlcNAc:undecaprenyl-phosphate GlcNAc-1-phosphate transferase
MLYLYCFLLAFAISLLLCPALRFIALKLSILDIPHTDIKTHKTPTPYLGGAAIAVSFWLSLSIIRIFTHFPTGTLYSLRGIFIGSFIIVLLGLFDDIKYKGLNFRPKFVIQSVAAILLILYGFQIKFIHPQWFAYVITVLWVVGITNALNIIDIMDGLAGGAALIAALGFFLIGVPQEEEIYVNFVAIALAGGLLGFLPFNFSRRLKMFMGDTGSLFIGFILAAASLGTRYTEINILGLFAPILILAIPIYDTVLVSYFRWKKGINPFLGSKDHFALRLESAGYTRGQIILMTYAAGIILSFSSFIVTRVGFYSALLIYAIIFAAALYIASRLSRFEVK